MEESKRDLPLSGGSGELRTALYFTEYLGHLGYKPCHVPFGRGAARLASWRGKNVPKFRLSEHFSLSDPICRKAFSLPPKAATYRVNSPALYIVLMDLVRQHHQALRPYRYCSCIFQRFNLPFSHINQLVIFFIPGLMLDAMPTLSMQRWLWKWHLLSFFFVCIDALFKCYNFKPFSPCF